GAEVIATFATPPVRTGRNGPLPQTVQTPKRYTGQDQEKPVRDAHRSIPGRIASLYKCKSRKRDNVVNLVIATKETPLNDTDVARCPTKRRVEVRKPAVKP